ncbi:DNA-directed RNA polymerase III subunit RPC7-like isoform X2 [Pocillopora verrucosa]|uniref:DNA-directed RNA polymerase III subunit RPC7-like isoform X2 n=1 Tax=Pocillopora verrucosa TaxID=203993 RepID=UPI002797880D|nr:DNA-directed RNA polymerase III subunit RPC7-like isoform X2 [Pocillopora verrucosa]
MAGRGRGRGRGRGFSFDVGVIGFKRGEALPATIQQPPPLYPPLDVKPLPLRQTDADEYMLALKQELRGCMRELPYFVKAEIKSKDIERFSDRYREKKKEELEWQPGPRIGKPVKKNSVGVEALKQLEEMVQKEGDNDQANDQEEEGTEGESGEEELEYDEEEQEEENDYLVSHFDDDEDAFMDDDDMDEGPIY